MKPVLYILLATILTFSASYSLGALLMRLLRLKLNRSEERFLSFIAGSACLSTLVFLFTAVGMARKWVFWTSGLVIVATGLWRRAYLPRGEALPPVPRIWNIAFWAVFAVFTWLYLGNALAPETSGDAISYHVALVTRYLREHRFPRITTNMYASLSEGLEMLFLYAFAIGKYSATAMCEFLFLLALPFGIASYGRRIGRPVAGVAGALIVYVSPVFGRVGTIAHNDVAGAAVVFALFYTIQIWREEGDRRLLILAGILAGFAFAVKYTLGIAVLYACAAVFLVLWKRQQPWLKPLAITAVSALAVMSPYLIKNTMVVANPVSPFFNRVFPNPYIYVSFEDEYVRQMHNYNGVTLAETPLEVTVRGSRLQGLLGPVFLLAPLALLALRFPQGRQLLLAAAVFLLPWLGNIGTRFLMPVAPFVALGLGLVFDAFPPLAAVLIVVHTVLSWPPVIPRYAEQYSWRIERSNWKYALRIASEEEYLRANIPDYDIGLALNRLVPANQRVLSPAMGNQAYQSREIVVPYQSVFGSQLYDVMFRATTEDMRPALRHTFSFPARDVRRLRVVLTKGGSAWIVSEVRLFHQGRELERDAKWRLRASAHPWQVQRAFDNSPLTVWTSDRRGAPGMFLEIDLGKPQRADKVTVDVPLNLDWATMRLEGDGALLAAASVTEASPWPSRMRRAAAEELKSNGIAWLVFKDGELLAEDLLTHQPQWGITQAAVSNGYRLWHLD